MIRFNWNLTKTPFSVHRFSSNWTVLCLRGWWSCRRCVVPSSSVSLDHRKSPALGTSASHWFPSVCGTTSWDCVHTLPDGCSSVVSARVVPLSCSLPGVASSPWNWLPPHNSRICRYGCGGLFVVSSFSLLPWWLLPAKPWCVLPVKRTCCFHYASRLWGHR